MKYKVGDNIIIVAGKDKGKTGQIARVLPKKQLVVVKGINVYKRHVKAREGIEGGVLSLERPLSVAKIALVDPVTKKPSRIGYKTQMGVKVRISKKSGTELDKPTKTVKEQKTNKSPKPKK